MVICPPSPRLLRAYLKVKEVSSRLFRPLPFLCSTQLMRWTPGHRQSTRARCSLLCEWWVDQCVFTKLEMFTGGWELVVKSAERESIKSCMALQNKSGPSGLPCCGISWDYYYYYYYWVLGHLLLFIIFCRLWYFIPKGIKYYNFINFHYFSVALVLHSHGH